MYSRKTEEIATAKRKSMSEEKIHTKNVFKGGVGN